MQESEAQMARCADERWARALRVVLRAHHLDIRDYKALRGEARIAFERAWDRRMLTLARRAGDWRPEWDHLLPEAA
ncbi:MAG TPA: hypothetical protein VFW98_08235 [Gemmatimonadaceae bacterium]|nr:hypothetical protein [Gemmatimonadaceae bacterium]